MPRQRRRIVGGMIYHCLNRGNGRQRLFHKPADYDAFVAIIAEAMDHASVGLLGYHLMPNHRHLLMVLRDVEANTLRAGLVARAQDWRWGSLAARMPAKPPVKGEDEASRAGAQALGEKYCDRGAIRPALDHSPKRLRLVIFWNPVGCHPWRSVKKRPSNPVVSCSRIT